MAFHFAHHLLFERQIFEHRLNHQIALREALIIGAAGYARHLLLALRRADITPFDLFAQAFPARFQRMVDALQVNIFDTDRQPGVDRRDAGDAAAHQPAAQYADLPQRARLGCGAGLFFYRRAGEEQATQRGGLRRHRQFAEGARLRPMPRFAALLDADANHVDNALRGRIVAVRFARGFALRQRKERVARQRRLHYAIAQRQLARGMPALQHARHCSFQQDRLRHRVIHQPHSARLLRPQGFAGEYQRQRLPQPDKPRQALGAARSRQQSQLNLRQTEPGFIIQATDARIAGERQLHPTTQAGAVDRRHDRKRQRRERRHRFLALSRQRLRLLGAAAVGDHADIGARDKIVRLAGDKHQTGQLRIAPRLVNYRRQLLREGGPQRIHLFARHVDDDNADVIRPHL